MYKKKKMAELHSQVPTSRRWMRLKERKLYRALHLACYMAE